MTPKSGVKYAGISCLIGKEEDGESLTIRQSKIWHFKGAFLDSFYPKKSDD